MKENQINREYNKSKFHGGYLKGVYYHHGVPQVPKDERKMQRISEIPNTETTIPRSTDVQSEGDRRYKVCGI